MTGSRLRSRATVQKLENASPRSKDDAPQAARVAAHGFRAVAGDLVLAAGGGAGAGETQAARLSSTAAVRALTAADAADAKIEDVLLALPGHAVTYPTFEGAAKAYAGKLDAYQSARHGEYERPGCRSKRAATTPRRRGYAADIRSRPGRTSGTRWAARIGTASSGPRTSR